MKLQNVRSEEFTRGTPMTDNRITEDKIFECFAAAQKADGLEKTAESFVDVEEYENAVMYPEFARFAKKAGHPEIASLFLKVAGEEKAHATWMRSIYSGMGTPEAGVDTVRATEALKQIRENCDKLMESNAEGLIENCLKVAIRVEEREYKDIYPRFRDQALAENNAEAAKVYQRVIDSERDHASWFAEALSKLQNKAVAEVVA
jgi:rubrerythrin